MRCVEIFAADVMHNDDALKRRAAKAGAWSYGQGFAFQAIWLCAFAILARILGPEAYGVAAIASLTIIFAEIFVDQVVTDALVHRRDLEQGHIDAMFVIQAVTSTAYAGLCWLAAAWIAAAFDQPLVAKLIPWLGIYTVLTGVCAVPIALLERDLRYDLIAYRTVAGIALGNGVGIAMALMGYGPWSLIAVQVVIAVVNFVFLFSRWRAKFTCRKRHFLEVIGPAARMSTVHGLVLFETNLPKIFLGLTGGPVAVAFFNVAWRVAFALRRVVLDPLASVWFPVVAQVQKDAARVVETTRIGIQAAAYLGIPAFAGMAAIAPVLIPLVFGESWRDAAGVVPALCALGVVWSLMIGTEPLLRGIGRQDLVLKRTLARVALAVVLLAVFGRSSPAAAGFSLAAAYAANWAWDLVLIKRATGLPVSTHLLLLAPPVAASGAMYAVVELLRVAMTSGAVHAGAVVGACVSTGVVVYLATAAAFAPARARMLAGRAAALLNRAAAN